MTPPEGGDPQAQQPQAPAPAPDGDDVASAAPESGVTQPIPPVPGPGETPTQTMPPTSGGQAYGPPPAGVPTAVYAAAAAPRRRGVRGLWREATATTGGRIATIVAAALAVVAVVGVIALGAAAIGRIGDDRHTVGAAQADRGEGMPGPGGRSFGDGTGPFGQRAPGGRSGRVPGVQNGLGGLGGLPALGGLLHGEFVAQGSGSGTTTMLFQVGEVTAYTRGSSLAVRSSDGFATTYRVDANSHLVASAVSSVSVGDQVRVLARKDGPTVTMVQVVSTGGGAASGGA
jgi:hypothetical protein